MIYVLDTDILSLLAHQDSPEAPRLRRHIAELPAEDGVVTIVVNYEEQMRGWMAALSRAKSSRLEIQIYDRLIQHLITFRRMTVLRYEERAAEIAGQLRRERISIGAMDLKIGSIALASNAVLITRNAVDFQRVSRLRIEDWSARGEL
jgi:tRNA(fMet)-specific endonuclease VapC